MTAAAPPEKMTNAELVARLDKYSEDPALHRSVVNVMAEAARRLSAPAPDGIREVVLGEGKIELVIIDEDERSGLLISPQPDVHAVGEPTGRKGAYILQRGDVVLWFSDDRARDVLRRVVVGNDADCRNALEEIAAEQNVYKGHGDYEIIPALTAEEAQMLARKALSAPPAASADERERIADLICAEGKLDQPHDPNCANRSEHLELADAIIGYRKLAHAQSVGQSAARVGELVNAVESHWKDRLDVRAYTRDELRGIDYVLDSIRRLSALPKGQDDEG